MAKQGEDVSRWDQARQLGQVLMCGFEGTEVNEDVITLIEKHHVGNIFLAPKNLRSASQATKLCLDLQNIARAAGHIFPLLIALDQENGGLNTLSDLPLINEFPSNLGLAATGSKTLTRQVAKATAQELKAVGVNFILGPVLDVMSDSHTKVLGPRSFGENPQEVSALGSQFIIGCRDAGLATCGKHFPSFEKIELLRAASTSPSINGSLHHLSQTSLAPFHDAIQQNIDAILVGDVAVTSSEMSATHACLSERIVDGLLRKEMGFKGVVVSECLELSLSRDIGIQGAAVMGVRAGCDLVMVCRSLPLQIEALQGLELGIEGGALEASKVEAAVSRILDLKSRCTSWELALNPTGAEGLKMLSQSHRELSKTAYNRSITILRDTKGIIPLTSNMTKDRSILLLTPLITPLPSSMYHSPEIGTSETRSSELIFQKFGATLGTHASTKVIHTSYSAHGIRPRHEDLISQAAAVVIITASANTNKYQRAFSKHATLLCSQKLSLSGPKPCIVVGKQFAPLAGGCGFPQQQDTSLHIPLAVTSPYDFAADTSIDPYICTYDYTECALRSLVRILCGEAPAKGKLPKGIVPAKSNGSRQQWLVEKFNPDRDSTSLTNLLNSVRSGPEAISLGLDFISADGLLCQHEHIKNHHFVVRNSSTNDLFGFCAAYYVEENATGYLGLLVVDEKRRKQSIGDSLHTRTIQTLEQISGIATIELGFPIPIALPGVPSSGGSQEPLHDWFGRRGWTFDSLATHSRALMQVSPDWKAPDGLSHFLSRPNVKYEMVHGSQDRAVGVLEHIRSIALPPVETLYRSVLTEKANIGIIRAKSAPDGTTIGMWRLISFSPERRVYSVFHAPGLRLADLCSRKGSAPPWSSTTPCRVLQTKTSPGTILVCGEGSELARRMPAHYGLLLGSLVSPAYEDHQIILESLVLLGLKHLKKQGVQTILFQTGNTPHLPPLQHWDCTPVQRFAFDSATRHVEPT